MRGALPTLAALLVLVLVAAGGCDKATPVAPAEATLSISANPTRIQPDGTSDITVIARKGDGSPVNEGTEINFSTSLGQIEPLVLTSDRGVATAVLSGRGERGMATVEASSGAAAAVMVDVQIGALPTIMTLQATPPQISQELPLDGQVIQLVATVFDDRGLALENLRVIFETEKGELASGGRVVLTDTEGQAFDTLTIVERDLAGLDGGVFLVSARTTQEGGAELFADEEILVTGFAANISVQASPSSVPQSGGEVMLTALVRDDFGEPLANAGVNFLTTVGALASGGGIIRTGSGGQASDMLMVSEEDLVAFSGNSFNVTAEVAGAGGALISDDFTISIQRGAPIASFTVTFQGTTTPTEARFTSTSSGNQPLVLSWDFGDGATAGNITPVTHDYGATTRGRFFDVTLTVENNLGMDTSMQTVQVPN